jgi:hypothetical protein
MSLIQILHLSMIFPENRFPLFGIMLYAAEQRRGERGVARRRPSGYSAAA